MFEKKNLDVCFLKEMPHYKLIKICHQEFLIDVGKADNGQINAYQ